MSQAGIVSLAVVERPQHAPVTVQQVLTQCVGDSEAELDALIEHAMIPAAAEACEHLLCRSIMLQTLRLTLNAFTPVIELPRPRVQAVTAISYRANAGGWQDLAGAAYELDPDAGAVTPTAAWPATSGLAAVRITYTAGYGAGTPDQQRQAVPAVVRAWILSMAATMVAHRERVLAGVSLAELPRPLADGMLDRERIWSR